MATSTFQIAAGTSLPAIRSTLKDGYGNVVPLDGVSLVELRMRRWGTTVYETFPAEILDAEGGTVEYLWETSDTADAGVYLYHWLVTWEDGRTEQFQAVDQVLTIT